MPSFTDRIISQRQGERMIPLSAIARICDITETAAEALLKEALAGRWVREGGDPKQMIEAPQRVLVRSTEPGPHYSSPGYPQSVLTQLIMEGALKPREQLSKAPFFSLTKDDQATVINAMVTGETLPQSISDVLDQRSMMAMLSVQNGLTDFVPPQQSR